jgi:hypothetical protein
MREAEQTKAKATQALKVPFWTVDSDVIVPTQTARQGTLCGENNPA